MTKKAPEEGPNGVDRWTSNGYGLVIDGKEVKPPKEETRKKADTSRFDEIEEE